ncbi:hypothetical protein T492DRAFT_1150584 [Pavlovales sp. CCMP2436]|nr:hypothetical protein T492DRAFT_1150584 [Pavlovales sp. CCMP2436]
MPLMDLGRELSSRGLMDTIGGTTRSLEDGIGGDLSNLCPRGVSLRRLSLLKAGSTARTAAAPRLTRLCKFEDEQLEAEYKSVPASATCTHVCALACATAACAHSLRPRTGATRAAHNLPSPPNRLFAYTTYYLRPGSPVTHRRNEVRHVLESRTGHIAVVAAGILAVGTFVNWAIAQLGPSPRAPDWTIIRYGCFWAVVWLAYAGFTRTPARLGVSLAQIETGFVLLFVTTHIPGILLTSGLREIPVIGRSVIPMFQLFFTSLAAGYAPINVRPCAVIACTATFGVALNTVWLT